jgi:hypothetical protein
VVQLVQYGRVIVQLAIHETGQAFAQFLRFIHTENPLSTISHDPVN